MTDASMTRFSQRLGAFMSGQLSLIDLEPAIQDIIAHGKDVQHAKDVVCMHRDAGRLAPALCDTLLACFEGKPMPQELTAPLADDPTAQVLALDETDVWNAAMAELGSVVDEATQPRPDATEPVSADNAPTEFQPTERINSHVDATEVVNSHVAPTVQINRHVAETQPINQHVGETQAIEPPASATAHDPTLVSESPLPSMPLPTAGTGSNWLNPEQWSELRSGPVEPGVVLKQRFLIEDQLGRGGMGTVFKARDKRKDEANDRDPFVAIKVLSKSFQEHPLALMALQREARKAQTLAHPNIVTVYDFDRDGTTVYMTMELMRGEPLDKVVRRHKDVGLDPDEAREIIVQMSAGLAYAHEKNIIHSDFKPGNVFITDDKRVKVLDFGIARAASFQGDDTSEKTLFDAGTLRSLTPAYASREMFDGDDPHPADDVYGLAVTAYILLTGRHPFDRKTAEQAHDLGLEPEPIPGIAKHEWQAIVDGLAFEREDRLENAAAFLAAFRGSQRRRRWVMGATAAFFAALAGFFAIQNAQPPGPAIPWEELTVQQQTDFTALIESGNGWLANDPPWIGGAYNDFAAAFDIHPDNPRAIEGLNAIAESLIGLHADADDSQTQRRLLQDIQTASVNPYLAEHDALRKLKAQLERNVGDENQ